jgi:membrane protein DedA with SNARE-associated domain
MPASPEGSLLDLLVPLGGGFLPGALFLGTFASEDLTCVAAGILVARGEVSFPVAVGACAAGIFVSDIGLYLLGRLAAAGLVRWSWVRARLPGRDSSGARWRRAFDRHGGKFVFASRFVPGSRLPAYLTAGAIGWSFRRFALLLAVAALLWTPILVGLAAWSGAAIEGALAAYGRFAWLAVPAVLLLGFLFARVVPLLFSGRGRRLLLGRWLRLRRFEYWPSAVVYAPVVLLLAAEALRRRTWLVFTCCNPGIPHGGLALESKGDILDQLPQDPGLPVAVAPYVRLRHGRPLDEALAVVARFLARGPVVLKPDQGERGSGVAVVRDLAHAEAWLRACPFDAIVQQFVSGPEFGLVWRRRPDGSGEIRSLARKIPPELRGDGRRSLEELILGDDREVAMARFHLRRHAARLDEVPAAGERIVLGELGTHARGACFVDARGFVTPQLRAAIDRLMAGVGGLDFGRFDLRVPSEAALQAGEGLRILEFNGVTGEPAHIYHPGRSWIRGIADLGSHWRAACATGAANRARGARPTGLREILGLVAALRRRPCFEAPQAGHVLEEFAAGRTGGDAGA